MKSVQITNCCLCYDKDFNKYNRVVFLFASYTGVDIHAVGGMKWREF
jgi:hypothetical protein